MKHVTIKDIARSLCISVSTVSRALTDDKNIRKETREMVIEEAKRLGYKRNPVAMNLKMGRTNTIGVIVPEMHTPYASQVINGIQDVLYKKNQKVMIAESDEKPERELENLKMMEQFMVDGLIVSLCSYRKNIEMYQQLAADGMAIVFYDRIPYGLKMPQVMVDDNVDSYFMVEHLIRLGRKRIVYLQGPDDIYNAYQRGLGYREAMEKFHLFDPELIVKTGMTFKNGADAIDRLIYNKVEFDTVFAFTDTLAIGAQNRLRALGKRVPEETFVAGFSGTFARFFYKKTAVPNCLSTAASLYRMIIGLLQTHIAAWVVAFASTWVVAFASARGVVWVFHIAFIARGNVLDNLAVAVVAGYLDGSVHQFLFDFHVRREDDTSGSDESACHLVHGFHALGSYAKSHGAQSWNSHGVTFGGPSLDYLACGIPTCLHHASAHSAAQSSLFDNLALRELVVKLGAEHVTILTFQLTHLDEGFLCFQINCHNTLNNL